MPGGDEILEAMATLGMKDPAGFANNSYSKMRDTVNGEIAFAVCLGMKPAVGTSGMTQLGIANNAPHPNAAKLFINWYLSRQGQALWQQVMNVKEVEASDSMRVDIAKDDVLPDGKRTLGREYQVIGFLDPEPVQKLLQEILK